MLAVTHSYMKLIFQSRFNYVHEFKRFPSLFILSRVFYRLCLNVDSELIWYWIEMDFNVWDNFRFFLGRLIDRGQYLVTLWTLNRSNWLWIHETWNRKGCDGSDVGRRATHITCAHWHLFRQISNHFACYFQIAFLLRTHSSSVTKFHFKCHKTDRKIIISAGDNRLINFTTLIDKWPKWP